MDRKDLDVTLYLVTDSSYHTEESLLRTVEEACKGGVTLVQLREKNKGGREYLDKAFKVKEITDRYNVPLIIDDRVDPHTPHTDGIISSLTLSLDLQIMPIR